MVLALAATVVAVPGALANRLFIRANSLVITLRCLAWLGGLFAANVDAKAGRAGIEQPSSRGRDSYTNSRCLFVFVGVAPSRRMDLNV